MGVIPLGVKPLKLFWVKSLCLLENGMSKRLSLQFFCSRGKSAPNTRNPNVTFGYFFCIVSAKSSNTSFATSIFFLPFQVSFILPETSSKKRIRTSLALKRLTSWPWTLLNSNSVKIKMTNGFNFSALIYQQMYTSCEYYRY